MAKAEKPRAKKWKMDYCQVCKKMTVHVTAILGFPFHCREQHPDDGIACASCGLVLPMAVKIARGLGAQKVLCKKCSPNIPRR